MRNFFIHCLKIAKCSGAVKEHALTQDAKGVYTKLMEEDEHGLLTRKLADKLWNKIMEWRLDPTQKKRLITTFTTWQGQFLALEEIDGAAVPDKQKRLWLSTTLEKR